MTSIVVFCAALLVLLVSVLFVLHCEYHAGFFGNVGLAFIGLAAFSRCTGIVDVWREGSLDVYLTPTGVMMWCGTAIFLGRQAVVFLSRWLGRHPTWYSTKKALEAERRAAAQDTVLG